MLWHVEGHVEGHASAPLHHRTVVDLNISYYNEFRTTVFGSIEILTR